jgi:SAM-dependent methyltransferase
MEARVAKYLVKLNREFYQKLAGPFSASRGQLQPGVLRVLESIPNEANMLDLGCGNGGVARELARRDHNGRYVGLDFSRELLQVAGSQDEGLDATFLQADLISTDWHLRPEINKQKFDFVLAFAVLHHIPGQELRMQLLQQIRGLLEEAGGFETRPYESKKFIHSNWQFLNSPRLKARIQSWADVGLAAADVDEGDYLLDWRSGGQGLRYVHQFNETELAGLAAESGFEIKETFLSDGKSGDLSLHSVWTPTKN